MKKKISILIIIFLSLSNCGYEPIYSNKNINFSIGEIERKNTKLNNDFVKIINSTINQKNENKINIKIRSNKEVFTKSKDSKGNPLIFELKINLTVIATDSSLEKEKTFAREMTYNNSDDKFNLKQYENELEKILIRNLVEDLIKYLSNIR